MQQLSTWRGILLFSSTIIGAGILALPVSAARAGFLPLIAAIVGLAVVSVFSGLYIAEVSLAEDEPAQLPDLARKHLGPFGFWAMILGMGVNIYGALIGYLAAGGQLLSALFPAMLPPWLGTLVYFAVGTFVLHGGIALVSQASKYLMYVMLVLLGAVIAITASGVQVSLLGRARWSATFDVFGVVLFSYIGHSVIPSIAVHLANRRHITLVIALGIALPCLLYLLWSTVVLGVIPAEAKSGASLLAADRAGQPATIPLGLIAGGSVVLLANIFAIFSTLTSYMGFGISLKDSYAGLAKQRQRPVSPLVLTALATVPPLLVALHSPNAFVFVLDIAGAIGGGLFVGILPVLIVLEARRKSDPAAPRVWGGSALPYLVLGVYCFGMALTVADLAGWYP